MQNPAKLNLTALLLASSLLMSCLACVCRCGLRAEPTAKGVPLRAQVGPGTVTGIGGVFFRSHDPARTTAWYEERLGITRREFPGEGSAHVLSYDSSGTSDCTGYTVWTVFSEEADHLAPSTAPFMINYRCDDLDALLARLREAGVTVLQGPEDWFNGRFAWVLDPDGRKVELWQPAPGH